jgi:hypothetical protein
MFKRQAGFISALLHRGIGGSSIFFNYVVWEAAEHFKQAFPCFEMKRMGGLISIHSEWFLLVLL